MSRSGKRRDEHYKLAAAAVDRIATVLLTGGLFAPVFQGQAMRWKTCLWILPAGLLHLLGQVFRQPHRPGLRGDMDPNWFAFCLGNGIAAIAGGFILWDIRQEKLRRGYFAPRPADPDKERRGDKAG